VHKCFYLWQLLAVPSQRLSGRVKVWTANYFAPQSQHLSRRALMFHLVTLRVPSNLPLNFYQHKRWLDLGEPYDAFLGSRSIVDDFNNIRDRYSPSPLLPSVVRDSRYPVVRDDRSHQRLLVSVDDCDNVRAGLLSYLYTRLGSIFRAGLLRLLRFYQHIV
jgi:hypothetical protein